MTITGTPKGTSGVYANAFAKITAHNGHILVAHLGRERFICVQKMDRKEGTTSNRIFGPAMNDPWHMAPVVGVGRDGYAHLTGGMRYGNAFREHDPETGKLKLKTYRGCATASSPTDRGMSAASRPRHPACQATRRDGW